MAHVIITGGSSGIGLALARNYLKRGFQVTLIGRSPERLSSARDLLLEEVEGSSDRLLPVVADVTDEGALAAAIESSETAFGECDLLVTSAGIVSPTEFDALDGQRFFEQIQTNLIGTANAVRCVYAGMKARRRGTILMVSSGAALIGIHGYTAYCASKSALVGFAEALRMEAEPHGLHVAISYPPDTDTPQLAGELPFRSRQAGTVMGKVRPWSADKVASHMVRTLERGGKHIYFGTNLTLLGRFGSLVKPALYWWFLRGDRQPK